MNPSFLLRSSLLVRQNLFDLLPSHQAPHPLLVARNLLLQIPPLAEIWQHGAPGHKAQIRVRALPAHQIPIPILLQHAIKNRRDALRLVGVALDGRGQFFVVEHGKPGRLPEVGPLPGDLVKEELLGEVFFREGGETEGVVFIVSFD